MGQRITIQYSIDLDDLGLEISRLVSQAAENVEETAAWLRHIIGRDADGDILSLNTVRELYATREKLEKVDHSLTDISTLIASYVQYQAQPPSVPNTVVNSDPEQSSPTLDESIEDFKSTVADVNPYDEVTD